MKATGFLLAALAVLPGAGRVIAADLEPDNAGPVKLVSVSWLGGAGNDAIVAVGVAPDGSPILAINAADLKLPGVQATQIGSASARPALVVPVAAKAGGNKAADDGLHGYIVRLSADGQKVLKATSLNSTHLRKMEVDEKGRIYVLGTQADGRNFVALLDADGKAVQGTIYHDGASDFGVDSNGEVVILAGAKMTRYAADFRTQKWTVSWKAYGGNRPGGMCVSPATGIAAVVGYGMTHTGKEPYKDPYAYGFDRDGKQVWALWNPEPGKEKGGQFGGNGLMADTTGLSAHVDTAGKIFFVLKADGGNSVCSRDPANVDEKLDAEVMRGVFQAGAGYGFKGASSTSVIFRVDPATGKLEKGTWMCAWLTKGRANGLKIDAATGGEKGLQFVVGGSASGCPTQAPWYKSPEGGYQGGGFLSIFDKDFKMVQSGYFPGSSITCVAYRAGTLVIGGQAVAENKAKDPSKPDAAETTYPVPTFKAIQPAFGGGEKDGYFAVFKVGDAGR